MCGIVATLDWGGAPCLDSVRSALNLLHHRGPDSASTWQSPGGKVTLGHARLSIVDLLTGNQPLANEDASIHVVVNGEFYDFEEIRRQLESLGHRFRTRSDSEIVLHLYEQFGIESLAHLRGEYSFVLWDERTQTLLAVRDRFGIKPLFYSQNKGRFYFASEVKALHALGVEASWDEQGFFEKITVNTPLEGRTLFRHVSELRPAHYLLATPAGFVENQYWDFNYPREGEISSNYTDDEYSEQFRAVLDNAVRVRLRADVPLGCYLSGGIDSCSILGLLQRHLSKPVRAFSVTFDDAAYDESALAREMADNAGAELISVPVSQASMAADFERCIWHTETLFANANSVAKFTLSRAVRDAGLKVVLTGEGSDEILGGYPPFVKDAIRHGTEREHEALAKGLGFQSDDFARVLQQSMPSIPAPFFARLGYVPSGFEAQESMLKLLAPTLPPSFRSDDIYSRLLNGLNLPNQLIGRPVLSQSMYLHSKTILPGYTLPVLGDRMEMAHSVEGRPPFLDHHVVEFACQLPVSQKVRGTAEKFVLRKAMRSIVPPSVCGRRKQPFTAPPALLNPGQPLYQLMQDTLRGDALTRIPFLRKEAVVQILDAAQTLSSDAKAVVEVPLMLILGACVLGDQFKL